MFGQGIRLFSFRGLRIELTLLGSVLTIFFVLSADTLVFPISPAVLLGLAIGTLLSLLIHELAHVLAGWWAGIKAEEIKLDLPAGVTRFKTRPDNWVRDALVYFAGPISNGLLWLLCQQGYELVLRQNASPWRDLGLILYYLANLNLFMAVFNALPCYPLDGGQALYSLLNRLGWNRAFSSALILLGGVLIVIDLVFDFTHILSRVYIGGIFIVVLAILIPVSSFNLLSQAAFRFSSPEAVSQAAKERAENKAQLEATKARKAQAAFENGLAHFRQKQFEATIDQFSLALSLKPGDTTSLQQRAAAFLEVGDSWQALVDYCQLIECEPKKAGYYFTRSQLYAKLGHPQAARKDLAYANRLKPLPQELGKPAQG